MQFSLLVGQWFAVRCLNKKPRTVEFYRDCEKILLAAWHEPQMAVAEVSADDVLFFAQRLAHHCPSRWNVFVAALRECVPAHGRLLKRKKLNSRNFVPPSQIQFEAFLLECDRDPRSTAGLVVRFLSLTGLRIEEARGVKWDNIFADRVEVPGSIAKSGKWRTVPALAGLADVLARLRALGNAEFVLPRASARTAITSACVRAGVPKMSFHCFRHYFATKCIESGVDVPTVARWLGHQDGGALLSKTYFHLLDSHSSRMAALVAIPSYSPK